MVVVVETSTLVLVKEVRVVVDVLRRGFVYGYLPVFGSCLRKSFDQREKVDV